MERSCLATRQMFTMFTLPIVLVLASLAARAVANPMELSTNVAQQEKRDLTTLTNGGVNEAAQTITRAGTAVTCSVTSVAGQHQTFIATVR